MVQTNWKYITISKEMAYSLETILKREKKKYMIKDKRELIRLILREFISSYEQGSFYEAEEAVRKGLDKMVHDE